MTSEIDIEQLGKWSQAREVSTRRGPRLLSKAKPDEAFWLAWNSSKAALQAAGVSIAKDAESGSWSALWWRELPPEVIQQRAENLIASRAADAEIEIPAPEGCRYFPFQKAAVRFALGKEGCLIGDEMGTGKSVETLGIINATPDIHRVLIICPASIKMNWYRECKKWLVRPFTIGIVDGKCFPSTDIAIVNYDLVHKYPKRLSFYWDLVVLDEAHRVKSPTARCTKAIVGYRASKKEQARGIVSTSGIPARRRLALTGTPIENRPAEIWTVLNYLDPQTWGNKWAFYKRYCDAKNNGFGFDIRGASNLSELQAKLRGSILIRRLKRDVMQDLPPITRMLVELEVDGADAAIAAERDTWNRHEADMVRMQAEMELAKVSDNEAAFKQAIERFRRESSAAFTEIARVRRETAMVKLPAAIEAINEDCGDGAGKCLVFAHHLDALHALKAAWGSEAVMVTGETLLPDRDKAVQRFQNDPSCTKFVGSIRATGEGLNLQAASVVYFVEEDWNPSKLSQCEARAHRYGQRDNVLVKHLLLAGSLDARMIGTIVDKQAIIDRALDDEKAVLVGEPVLVPKAPQNGSRKHLEDDGLLITSEQCRAILRGLQLLSGVCDGALKLDGAGFNKVDQRVGHELAQQNWLSPRQASLGRVLLKRYRKQLPQDVFDTIG